MIELRQAQKYVKYMEKLGWVVERVGNTNIFVNKFLFTSIIKIQRPNNLLKKVDIKKIVKKHNAFIVYIEPKDFNQQEYFIKNLGFIKTNNVLLPSKTIRINVQLKDDELLSRMHYKTRYNIKKSKNIGVKIIRSKDIGEFSHLWHKCALQRGMFISLAKEIKTIYNVFGNDAQILKAEFNGKMVGAVLIIFANNVSYYMYAAASKLGKQLFAPSLLVWETLKESKKRGMQFFDFEGVYDPRFPIDSWKGFSRFKESFKGGELIYPSPLKKIYVPWLLHI